MRAVAPRIADVQPAVEPYVRLMEAFTAGTMPVHRFERAYLDTFVDDATAWPEALYQILNDAFLDVEAFYPDSTIHDEWDIDEAELRRRVVRALDDLRAMGLVGG